MVAFTTIACLVSLASALLLQPSANSTGPQAALVFFQGTQVPAASYVDLLTQVQQQFPGRLYVAIPEFEGNIPLPPQIPLAQGYVSDAISQLSAAGWNNSTESLFYGAHSLGGVIAQEYALAAPKGSIAGLVLMGSTIVRFNEAAWKPLGIPWTTIGGEFDGLFVQSRTAEAWFKYASNPATPMILLRNITHMAFAEFVNPPAHPRDNDIKSRISIEEARQIISPVITSFLTVNTAGMKSTDVQTSQASLASLVAASGIFFGPTLAALKLEGSSHLVPQCDSDAAIYAQCPYYAVFPVQSKVRSLSSDTTCQCGVPFAAQAQAIVAGFNGTKYTIESTNAVHDAGSLAQEHMPHLWNNLTNCEGSGCLLNVTTVAQLVFSTLDSVIDVGSSIAATEIRMKFKSRQSILQVTSNPDAGSLSTAQTDGSVCKQINQASLDLAMSLIPSDKLALYQKYGQKYVIGDDIPPIVSAGPAWIYSPLQYNAATENGQSIIKVQSIAFTTSVNAPFGIQTLSGYTYCKVLSPAKVLEWIYTDSLRSTLVVSAAGQW